jgi:glucan biosynthesis protein C
MTHNAPSTGRLIFFDNLRYLFVLFVVVEHSAHAWDGLDWWAVAEPGISLLAAWLAAFSDVFAMPLLFYIAGYFALPNLQKKGLAGFVVGKLKRLGIPWLICILVVTPIFLLIYHYTRGGMSLSQSYLAIWLEEMHKALQFNYGLHPRHQPVQSALHVVPFAFNAVLFPVRPVQPFCPQLAGRRA